MKSMTPFLMFEGRAEEAILFYRSVFKEFEVVFINYFGTGDMKCKVMQSLVNIHGNNIIINDASITHDFSFTLSMNFFIECETDKEQIYLYNKCISKGSIFMSLDDYGFSKLYAFVTDPLGVGWQLN